jgi:radical SAM protein with 4Fe4S-binding SPASM domain
MSMELFNQLLEQYDAMGGGYLTLIPMVGDILVDRHLMERMDSLAAYAKTIEPAMYTNLYALDRFTDDNVAQMLRTLRRLFVSWYGLTEEESKQITRKKSLPKVIQQMQRLLAIREKEGIDADIKVGFRSLHAYPPAKLEAFMRENFGCVLPYQHVHTYGNWGNTTEGLLPGEALWKPVEINVSPCLIMAIYLTVYWDGRVTACGCCDFDASKELALGNLDEQSLLEIYNGPANQHLWKRHQDGDLPAICKKCTYHQKLYDLHTTHLAVTDVLTFVA